MTQASFQDYQTCAEILSNDNLVISAAELHGLLSGIICTGLSAKSNMLALLYDYTNQGIVWPSSAKAMAKALFNQTTTELNSELLEFDLLQPNEDTPLAVQAQALSDWVSGFLAGFGLAGTSEITSKDGIEILEDLAEIAKLGIDEDENENEQLAMIMEIREHVRICILSLYADNLLDIKLCELYNETQYNQHPL